MLKTMLIVVSSFQGGPLVHTQILESPRACRLAAQTVVLMIQQQARTNITSPHRDLTVDHDEKTGEWRLSTGVIGREVARLRCSDVG